MARPNTSDVSMRFIVRMPDKCWRVLLELGGTLIERRYFSDLQLGGKSASLEKARQWRDKGVLKHKIPLRTYDGNGFCVQQSRNTTGTVGISLAIEKRGKYESAFWSVTTQKDGRQVRVRRSIRKYGYTKAWQEVEAIRRAKTKLRPQRTPPPPTEKLLVWADKLGVTLPVEKKTTRLKR